MKKASFHSKTMNIMTMYIVKKRIYSPAKSAFILSKPGFGMVRWLWQFPDDVISNRNWGRFLYQFIFYLFMKAIDYIKLAFSVILCLLAGYIGSFFNINAIPTWYAALNKPFFNPPNWIFAPVWTMLFVLMGVALFLVWRKGWHKVKFAMILFFVQLVLNVFWSMFFFYLQNPFLAFIEIIILWVVIYWTIMKFYRISHPAGYLMIPYILWVSFAAILNFSILVLN